MLQRLYTQTHFRLQRTGNALRIIKKCSSMNTTISQGTKVCAVITSQCRLTHARTATQQVRNGDADHGNGLWHTAKFSRPSSQLGPKAVSNQYTKRNGNDGSITPVIQLVHGFLAARQVNPYAGS